ncbi:hypothetical protein CLM62_44780 [Streptomyces sp. SA15]|uniref:hypothetical protein n=1 Tax=Streptomyces sp. SA15 TaxID=934019 RepID=UPI000BB0BACC|nr:hypothetical protein [Streptomyces sp. SA15]PAZ09611.1 hypothetical protein CLM62_44780 [Streptomyces sp. SA15]
MTARPTTARSGHAPWAGRRTSRAPRSAFSDAADGGQIVGHSGRVHACRRRGRLGDVTEAPQSLRRGTETSHA